MLPSPYLSSPVAVAEPHCWEWATGTRHSLELATGVSGTAEKGWTHNPGWGCPELTGLGCPSEGQDVGKGQGPSLATTPSWASPSLAWALLSHSPAGLLLPLVNTRWHHGGQELSCSRHELR